jgi:hypothetical protein
MEYGFESADGKAGALGAALVSKSDSQVVDAGRDGGLGSSLINALVGQTIGLCRLPFFARE